MLGGIAPAWAAPPNVTHLFPAGVQRGQAVEVTVGGTVDPWPPRAWVSGTGVTVQPSQSRGALTVTAEAAATPGVRWLRLYNDEGASALRPLFVGNLSEVTEKEPNDDPLAPQKLDAAAVVVNGRLGRGGDVDGFAVRLTKGQTLVAALEANFTLGAPMDAVLQVTSAAGFVLAQDHDTRGLDPQVVFTAPADGVYLVRTFAFPATPDSNIAFDGTERFVYRLTLTTTGFADYAFPLAVTRGQTTTVALVGWNLPASTQQIPVQPAADTETVTVSHPEAANAVTVRVEEHATAAEREPNGPDRPQPITLPITVSGRLDAPGDVDAYQFEAKKGEKRVFQVESQALGFPLDAVLHVTDAAGKPIAKVDDTGGSPDARDAELVFTAPADGVYRVEVSDLHSNGGPRYAYRLRAVLDAPTFDLTLAADAFTLTPGKPLEIPVTVNRRSGFAGEVEVSARGLPEGVTAAPVVAAASAAPVGGRGRNRNRGPTVTLTLTATAGPVTGTFQVVGRAVGGAGAERVARVAGRGAEAATLPTWLTVLKPPAAK